jgi:hypothetical protein
LDLRRQLDEVLFRAQRATRAEFETFVVKALTTFDPSRTETKHWC